MRLNRESVDGKALRKFKDKQRYKPTKKQLNDPIDFHIIQIKRLAQELRRELTPEKIAAIRIHQKHIKGLCPKKYHWACKNGWNPLWQLDRHLEGLAEAKKQMEALNAK